MDLSRVDTNSQGPVKLSRRSSRAPCEVRVMDKLEQLREVRKEYGSEAYYLQMGDFATKDYWFYLRVVLGYNFLDEWDHGEEMIWFLEQNLGSPMIFLVPRGSCKTGSITVPFLPWSLARDPTLRGIITNVRDPKARQFARQAASVITSPRYQACFPYVQPGIKWGEEGYFTAKLEEEEGITEETELDTVEGRVEPSIGSYGVGGNVTSAHVRVFIHDDLVSEATYKSEVERTAAISLLEESFNCIDPGGQMILTATRWSPDDVYDQYVSGDKPGPSGEKFKVFRRGAYKTRFVFDEGQNQIVNEIFNPYRIFVDKNGKRQRVGYTLEFLQGREKAKPDAYLALYENTPIGDANRRLDPELIKGFEAIPFDLSSEVRVGIEAGGTQNVLYNALIKSMRDNSRTFGVMKFVPPRNDDKKSQIEAALGHLIREERFYCQKDFWRMSGVKKEIEDFPIGLQDDLLDAMKWAALKAPRHIKGAPPIPFIAIDPAFTAEGHSNSTAIVVACWHGADFYILEGKKFKTQESDMIFRELYRYYDKYTSGGVKRERREARTLGFYSPGNERKTVSQKSMKEAKLWGAGAYTAFYLKQEEENERRRNGENGSEQDSGTAELEES